jgi:hypothetical protein
MSRSRGPGSGLRAKQAGILDDKAALIKSVQKYLGGPRMVFGGSAGDNHFSHGCKSRRQHGSQMSGGNH